MATAAAVAIAMATVGIGSLAGPLTGVLVEHLLAAGGAEVVLLSIVFRRPPGRFGVDIHLAYRVECHSLHLFPSRLTGGVYFLNMRDNVITVTELIAMARPASSGLNMMPKAG